MLDLFVAADARFSNEESPARTAFIDAFLARLRSNAAAWNTDGKPSDTFFDPSLDEV